MSFITGCVLLWCYLSNIAFSAEEEATGPQREYKSYAEHHDHTIEFVDVNGLDKVIRNRRVDLIGTGFGFLEGPKWIKDHLLFTELLTDKIWEYNPRRNKFINVAKYEKCGPAGIAWHINFPDEIYIACFMDGSVLKVDGKTYRIQQKWDYRNYADRDDIAFMVDDVVIDPNGNIYFTDMPIKPYREIPEDSKKTGGVYMIERGKNEIKLVEHLAYGPNGIALNKDETIVAASNCIDLPLGKWNYELSQKRDNNQLYVRGYKIKENNEPFMYFRTNDAEFSNFFTHNNKYDYFLDSSEFDTNGNFWQAVYLKNKETNKMDGGQASIFRNNINGDKPEYIGSIRIHKNEMAFTNFENGGDGYMYATAGDLKDNVGTLLRIRLNDGRIKYMKSEL